MTTLGGSCDPRFRAVKDVFTASFASGAELGAAVSVVVDGVTVVELWGGHADKARSRPWEKDTLANLFSTTKGWTALCAHRLVDEGKLDLDAPVARYWPEFAQAGKSAVRVHELLSHRAGLPAVREPLPPAAMLEWSTMVDVLAAEAPWWEPGTKHGYHPVTFAWLVGEVLRRAAGTTTGAYFRERFAAPLGLDAHIGLAAEHDARCAELQNARRDPSRPTLFDRIVAEPESMTAKAFTNPMTMLLPGMLASRAWRGAEVPSVNGHATATAVARLYGAVTKMLSAESLARCHEERSLGEDAVLGVVTRFGLGFMLSQPGDAFGPSPRAFGHPGAGGSLGFADPDAKLGFGYVPNRMGTSILVDPRARALIDAVYASL